MEQILLKAATTATDKGIFEAVISTSAPDREMDVVDPAGMVRALQKWTTTGKRIPLAWNHSGDPENQIGYIEPSSAKAIGDQVVVSGQIDLESEVGQHAWRLVKAGTLGFSFGYLILDGSKRKGGGRNITELDVFEITATPTPMNNDTRVLGYKGATADELRKEADAIAEEFANVDPEPDEYAMLRITHEEMAGLAAGELKAVWSASFIDGLPDSAFLYVESGGSKDSDGKTTPRSLRHFPYKDSSGNVDLPHLRNALARIPDADIPASVKESLTAKAQGILNDANKSVDEMTKETKQSRVVDPLRSKAEAIALEYLSDGESRRKPPRGKVADKPVPEFSPDEMRKRMRDEMIMNLSGVNEI